MTKIFETQFEKGSYIDRFTKSIHSTKLNNGFKRTEKGIALYCEGTGYISYNNTTDVFGVLDSVVTSGVAFSGEAWFKIEEAGVVQHILGFTNTAGDRYVLGIHSTDELRFSELGGSAKSGGTIDIGKWYHVIFTQTTANGFSLYLNNVELTGTTANSLHYANEFLSISSGSSGGSPLKGVVGKVIFYDHILTPTDRARAMREFTEAMTEGVDKYPKFFPELKPTDLSHEVDLVTGEDLVTNGSFDTDSDWTKGSGWTITGGKAVAAGASGNLQQDNVVTAGRRYKATYTISDYSAGSVRIVVGGTAGGSYAANGTYAAYFTASSSAHIWLDPVATPFSAKIDDVIIQEVKGLAAAYNMVPEDGYITDISGNGHINSNQFSSIPATNEGMYFRSSDVGVNLGANWVNSITTVYTICMRVKANQNGAIIGDGSSSDYIYSNSTSAMRHRYGGGTLITYTLPVNTINYDEFFDVVISRDGTTSNCWVDGIASTDNPKITAGTEEFVFSWIGGYASLPFTGTVEEILIYNYAWTEQQAKDYHNKFARRGALRENFKYEPVGTAVPRGWIEGTGTYEIKEWIVEEGELITNGGFDTDSNWDKGTGWTISGGKGVATAATGNLSQLNFLSVGHRYRTTYTISDYVSGTVRIQCGTGGIGTTRSANGTYTEIITALTTDDLLINGLTAFTGNIDDVSVVEVEPLPEFKTGTKYHECTSTGETAMPSKQAYGTWEFDFFPTDGIILLINLFNTKADGSGDGYAFRCNNSQVCGLYEVNAGALTYKFYTVSTYIKPDTWHRAKVTRTKNGEFYTYIKGGSFGDDDFTLVVADTGTNPVTDTTNTVGGYFTTDFTNGNGGYIANIKITEGVEQ